MNERMNERLNERMNEWMRLACIAGLFAPTLFMSTVDWLA
jgi:hypothetical protein